MRVYDLMNLLADMPSGAEVICWSALTVDELEGGLVLDENEDDTLYEIAKPLDSVEKSGNHINLCF